MEALLLATDHGASNSALINAIALGGPFALILVFLQWDRWKRHHPDNDQKNKED